MNYITVKEIAEKWNVSMRLVYRYCTQGRIPDAYQEFGIWYIPENAAKPIRKKKEASQLPKLLKTLIKQRDGRMYRGLYEYLQINMVYNNGRMASNRLTRDQIEVLYKTDRIFTNKESINQLFKEYEAQKDIGFHEILDLHVRFERIRPFEDCNGRIGRLLMLKECLRHEVTPFVIDDKRRTGYLDGIRQWDEDRSILMDVCMEAQMRFEAQIVLQGLLECQSQHMRAYHKGGNR